MMMPEQIRIPGVKVGSHTGPISYKAFKAEVQARYSYAWAEHHRWVAEQKAKGTYNGLMSSGYATNGFARDVDNADEEWASLPESLKKPARPAHRLPDQEGSTS